MNTAISWMVLAYYAVLFTERVQSLIRSLLSGQGLFRDGFHASVNVAVILSLVVAVMLLCGWNRDFWRSLFQPSVTPDYAMLAITVGAILVSGMMHTDFTIAPVQFVSYGFLILGMILRTVQVAGSGHAHVFMLVFSLIYLTLFSMAIPVVYEEFSLGHHVLFHVVESVTALLLVGGFTWMLRMVFLGQGENLLLWIPFLIMLVLDVAVLALRWTKTVNTFVLIFYGLSVLTFIAGKIIFPLLRK
ncbi:MAG: hypothetical protein IKS35_03680 [Clostridia bacterium]|nr:hypothetical protein [Clostridia bacterium]